VPKKQDEQRVVTRRVISRAFEGDEAPAELSVGIVSLVELCQVAMPDPERIRASLKDAGFTPGPQAKADEAGRMLALDKNVVAKPVRRLRHELYGHYRNETPVLILLSTGESDDGGIVFCTALFRGAIEADAVKAAAHVTKKQPFTGASIRNHEGTTVRRVFWDVEDAAGVRGFMVSGPQNVEALDLPRAITAFNKVASRPS
jgi:hypothetical protein